MKRLLLVACLLAVAGCATSRLESYIGQDVRRAVVKNGEPSNVMDMGDGLRAFQWAMNKSYTAPVMANSYGNVNAYGNSAYYTNSTMVSGGQTSRWTCLYTLYARWDEARQGWIVEGIEKPSWSCQ